MADTRKIVKVFLASPGDLTEERRAAKLAVDDLNEMIADEFGYQVELVGWEDTVSVYGRPQATINLELGRCELFIGLMWKKWGTPPDVSGPYTSGFEEEFETSVQRHVAEGRPEISLLFKEVDAEFLSDPGEDLKKVLAFKDKLIAEKKILFSSFSDIREFETKVRQCIWKYVAQLRAQNIKEASVKNQAPATGGERPQTAETANSQAETPLSVQGAKFLRDFISKTERNAEEDPISAVEVARFRLLAALVGVEGNDNRLLGVHDANLIFAEGDKFSLGYEELLGLVAAGLRNYSNENTPLWRWFSEIDGFNAKLLPQYSILGADNKQRIGALACMRLVAEPLKPKTRERFIKIWLATTASSDLRTAALAYLGDCGIGSDLISIRQEFDKGDNQTVNAAAEAIIRINLRDSRQKGIRALYDLQPTSINSNVLETLFEKEYSLSNDLLEIGLGHRSPDVRRVVVRLLRDRRALSSDMAEPLMSDNDAVVRYEALMATVDHGRDVSDSEAKKILVTQSRPGLFGFGGGLGLINSDTTAERCFSEFQLGGLQSKHERELEEIAAAASIFDRTAEFVLAERQFKNRGDQVRRDVKDQYKTRFAMALDAMIKKHGAAGAEFVERARPLEEGTRKNLTRSGLDIICRKGDATDLGLIRSTLKSGFIGSSASDIEYLARFGEWEDISLIIYAVGIPEVGTASAARSLLFETVDLRYKAAARAIYALGRTRVSEILEMKQPSNLLRLFITEISDKAYRALSDDSLVQLMRLEADRVRKIAAVRCVRTLSKARVRKLLTAYISGTESHYYNVVHWLDFGASTPRELALPAVERILSEESRK